MKLSGWQWLAASSLLLAALGTNAKTRPRYGGTLHVSMREAPNSLDPADTTQLDSFARRNLTFLIFETLVTTDDNGYIRPGLATSWQSTNSGQRWQFRLRMGVTFHDGTALIPVVAAASLRAGNPSWKITSDADSVTIELDAPRFQVLDELALPSNAIAKKADNGKIFGTGPFQIAEWQPGKSLRLAASENYWAGRPYLDAIEIEFGKSFHDQLIALELDKADLIEIPSEQSHRISITNHRLSSSQPMELIALVFTHDAQSPEEKSLREALALSVERVSIRNVILQGTGQPAASILPNWMSGYAFTFSTASDLPRARHLRDETRTAPTWTISYDTADSFAGRLAERIALNARDAGLRVQPTEAPVADVRVTRITMSIAPVVTLDVVAASAGLPPPQINGNSAEDLYAAERSLLATQRVIPLFHLPVVYAASPSLQDWKPGPDGVWNLCDAWLARENTGSGNP
jgi:ABC-type transport system substrate-binding protein